MRNSKPKLFMRNGVWCVGNIVYSNAWFIYCAVEWMKRQNHKLARA